MSGESILISIITVVDNYTKFVNGFFLNIKELIDEPLIHQIIIFNNCCEDLAIYELFKILDGFKKVHTDHSMKKYDLCDLKFDICKQSESIHIFYLDQNIRLNCLHFLIELYIEWALKDDTGVFYIEEKEAHKYFQAKSIKKEKFFLAINKNRVTPTNFAINFLNIEARKVMQHLKEEEISKK
tara:strand:+ start:2354 stop:2902 length:549 start_codon:yes stop_codon:yes gene_type:complete